MFKLNRKTNSIVYSSGKPRCLVNSLTFPLSVIIGVAYQYDTHLRIDRSLRSKRARLGQCIVRDATPVKSWFTSRGIARSRTAC